MKKYSFLVTFLIASWLVCNAQIAPVTQYSTQGILPHNTVRSLLLSEDGTLWVGTDNGLLKKYNNSTTNYFEEDGLPLNNIWALAEDANHDLWVGSYGNGIAHFDGSHFTPIDTNHGLIHNEITHLNVFGNLLYVGSSDGISILTISNKKIVASFKNGKDSLMRISGFFEFENAVFATTYNSGIFKIPKDKNGFSLEKISDHQLIYAAKKIGDSLFASNKESVSVVAIYDLLNDQNPEFKESKSPSIIWDYAVSKNNTVYGAAWGIFEENGGLFPFSKDGKSTKKISGIKSDKLISLAYDRHLEVLYAGTLDNGMYKVSLNSAVQFYPSNHKKTIDIAHFNTHTIRLFNDGVEIATKKYNAAFFKKQEVTYVNTYKNDLPSHEDYFYELKYDTPAAEIIFYGIKKSRTHVWINTNTGLYKFQPDGTFESYLPLHTLEFDFTAENKLIETNPYHGVRIYENENPLKYTYHKANLPTTPTDIVGTLRTEQATYFLSVFKGLFSYDGKFTSFLKSGLWDEKKLRHSTIYKNAMAVSNEFGDVFILDPENPFKVSEKIPRKKIRGNTISFLNSYKDWLIIATENGITFYNGEKQLFLDGEQGISKPVFASSVSENILYLATDGGEYHVDLHRVLNPENRIDALFVNQFKVNDSIIKIANTPLKLSASQNNIKIQIETNAHPFPNKLRFQYKMKKNAEWAQLEAQEIDLHFLEPANYNVAVRVLDASTGQQFEKSVLIFTIAPPLYAQWWFIALTGGLFIVLTYNYFNRKKRQHQLIALKKIAANKHIEKLKTEALLAQMNPHFIFNALNSIKHLVLIGENTKASSYISKFAALVRTNLNNAQRPITTLKEELDYLKIYCEIENERHGNRISINYEVDPTVDTTQTEIPTLVLQPFIENAFVHAFPPSIKNPSLILSIKPLEDDTIKYTIKDNGIGNKKIAKTTPSTSKGIFLIKERLHFLNYDVATALTIEYTVHGTSVILIL